MSTDPLDRYRSIMNNTEAPSRLSNHVLQQAREQKDLPNETVSCRSTANQPTAQILSLKRTRVKGFALAACTVFALGMGALILSPLMATHSTNSNSTEQPTNAIPEPFNFSVKAYADSTNTLLSFGADGSIVFDRNTYGALPQKPAYYTEGYFTGCLFRIEGEDVVSATASIDRGQLYSYTAEEFVKSDDPDRWAEALRWKPSQAGQEGFYRTYDFVQPQDTNDGLDRTNPDKLCRVALSTLMGQSTTLDSEELAAMSSGNYSLGIWTNEDFPDIAGPEGMFNVLDTLDGAHLTVTLTFTDGSTSTKIIELHSADMKFQLVPAQHSGTQVLQVMPELADASADEGDGISILRSLYGTVIDESYQQA